MEQNVLNLSLWQMFTQPSRYSSKLTSLWSVLWWLWLLPLPWLPWALAHTGGLAICVFLTCKQNLSPTVHCPSLPDGKTLTHSVLHLSGGQRKSAGARCSVFMKRWRSVRRPARRDTHVSTYKAHPPYHREFTFREVFLLLWRIVRSLSITGWRAAEPTGSWMALLRTVKGAVLFLVVGWCKHGEFQSVGKKQR